MRKELNLVDERVDRFNAYLNKLYFAGRLKLSDLQSFRDILREIREMFERLRMATLFGYAPRGVRKDIEKLNSELTLMEYNVSLVVAGSF